MYSLGIDMGASSVKIGLLQGENTPVATMEEVHHGTPLRSLYNLLTALYATHSPSAITKAAATGAGAALLTDENTSFPTIDSIPAIHAGMRMLCPQANSVMEMGAQSARYITGLREEGAPAFSMNENCAGGTGSFFEDQMHRLGLDIRDYSSRIQEAESVPRLSGRCSVFAKTDITHHQQEGASTADILLGLCYAAVRNFKGTIVRSLPVHPPLAFCGGVVKNAGVRLAAREIFGLEEHEWFASDEFVFAQALGAAAQAMVHAQDFNADAFRSTLQNKLAASPLSADTTHKPPLTLLPGTILTDPPTVCPDGAFTASLGIDVGSTSTNLVLFQDDGTLADYQYLRTNGDPQKAVRNGLASIEQRLGKKVTVTSVGVTGSGRHLIGKMVGADTIVDEITAQAQGAMHADPQADTVFEIGGQDSKFISLKDGAVSDFQMNKICAAGTGSFIEEQAVRMGIQRPQQIGPLALRAETSADLGERCTVFMESSISAHLSAGVKKEDILAGLCVSTVNNYLNKVVGRKSVGNRIVLQGGVAYNAGIVAAFQAKYGGRLRISPYFPISGAVGAAILAARSETATQYKGFDLRKETDTNHEWRNRSIAGHSAFYKKSQNLLLEGYDGSIDPNKKTVGVPRVLVIHKLFPLVNRFFRHLGYNVLLSSETNADTVALSQAHTQSETCYPVKLIHGHMMQLVEKKVDYIFLPRVHTMKHETSHVEHNYGCVYMQTAPLFVAKVLNLEERGIELLSPRFSLDFGSRAMAAAMMGVGKKLGKSKPQCMKALMAGAMAVRKYTSKLEEQGRKLMEGIRPDEKVLVLITRNYGISDPILNMGIPETLLRYGYKIITLSHLPAHDVDLSGDHPDLCWPFGQHILSGAKLVRNHPNLYAVYLTNHGCGPDTMLSHLFAEEMGDKPYLQIEVDEHFSQVGVVTRIEAFLNSLNTRSPAERKSLRGFPAPPTGKTDIERRPQKEAPFYLPSLRPYSGLIAAWLNRLGYTTRELPASTPESLALGKKEASSKEYLSFTAALGAVLAAAPNAEPGSQFLVPGTEGAEADAQYSRCIRSILDRKGYASLRIVAPILETLPSQMSRFGELFLTVLAGDIVQAAPPRVRQRLEETFLHQILRQPLTVDWMLEQLHSALQTCKTDDTAPARSLFVLGEPACLWDGQLNHHLLRQTEERGFTLQSMPFSEYLWFLWRDREQNQSAMLSLALCERQMDAVSESLGTLSVFSNNRERLFEIANPPLALFAGANGRYRYAKAAEMLRRGHAVITMHSLYENTGTILSVLLAEEKQALLELGMDDTCEKIARERLDSFLHYQTKKMQSADKEPHAFAGAISTRANERRNPTASAEKEVSLGSFRSKDHADSPMESCVRK